MGSNWRNLRQSFFLVCYVIILFITFFFLSLSPFALKGCHYPSPVTGYGTLVLATQPLTSSAQPLLVQMESKLPIWVLRCFSFGAQLVLDALSSREFLVCFFSSSFIHSLDLF